MAKIIDEDKRNWDEKLDTVLMGYRASRQASTKQSPYYMLFQRQMRLPIDVEMLPQSPIVDEDIENPEEIVDILLESRGKVFQEAHENIKNAHKKTKGDI